MRMFTIGRTGVLAAGLLLLAGGALAEEPASFGDALADGSVKLNLRYRFESVDQDGISKDASASTLKTRLTYKSASYKGASLVLEADSVTYLGSDRFNNTRNGETTFPVVADPDGAHINQAYFKFAVGKGDVLVGRQRILIDGQRFVGGVGWRQNEQTYDAIRIKQKFTDNFDLDYSYVENVSRIFGPDNGAPADDLETDTHLLNLKYKLPIGKLTGYYYAMDFDDAAAFSNSTLGVSYQHTFKSGDLSFPFRVEYATQDDDGDNPVSYSADYALVEVGVKKDKFLAKISHEVLEGSDTAGESFRTPLATLHKWQGWTDKFLGTPTGGIEDTYLTFKYKTLTVMWHEFDSETGSGNLGSELDIAWAYKFGKRYSLLLKYADYDADDHASDTRKAWVMLSASF
ncbi:MAG: alginate export family protein [Gammaproteobacteria bacterium]|nr:alginate export family protein [Gammaproteobacteria bacterium]MBT4493415.1 alginate export family protein [Gammaproteobacteria bacterium]